jgi:NOGCT (NUC087) domain
MDGKNVADFIDPDIAEKLEALEREEERLEAEGFYASDDSIVSRFRFRRLSTHLFRPTQTMKEKLKSSEQQKCTKHPPSRRKR